MQVLLPERDLERFQRIARERGVTLAEWVRHTLRAAASRVSLGDADTRLSLVRAAAKHRFPAPDIDQMLAEIERGYDERAPD